MASGTSRLSSESAALEPGSKPEKLNECSFVAGSGFNEEAESLKLQQLSLLSYEQENQAGVLSPSAGDVGASRLLSAEV